MQRKASLVLLLLLSVLSLGLSSCGGTEAVVEHAQLLLGGSLSNFSGPDGADPDLRAVAREMATGREYDLTPLGFTIAAGAATSTAPLGSDFGDAWGDVVINGALATVTLTPDAQPATAIDPEMSGEFDLAEAQAAIDNPGSSFTVTWRFTWTDGTGAHDLSAEQVLTGTDFVAE